MMNWKKSAFLLMISGGFFSGCLVTDEALLPPRKAVQGADLRNDIGTRAVLGYHNAVRQYLRDKSLSTNVFDLRDINDHYAAVFLLSSSYFTKAEAYTYYTRRSSEECLETVLWHSMTYSYQYLNRVEGTFVRAGDSLVKTVHSNQYGEAAVFGASAAADCNLKETGNILETGEFGF